MNKVMVKNKPKKMTNQIGLIAVIAALCVVFTVLNSSFIVPENIVNIVRQSSVMIIVAMGATFVMISGELDLSIGGIACLTGIVVSLTLTNGVSLGVSIVIGLCIGILFGALNGFLTTKFRLPSMIVTLATMNIANGSASLLTGGTAIYGLPDSFEFIGRGYIGFLPAQVVFMILIVIICAVVLAKTLFGRYAFAIGGNETVARLSGINIKRYKVLYFVICGVCASFAGMILSSRLASGQPNLASNMMMDTITAVVIGGTAMSGGSGSIFGSVLGTLLLTIISNGLTINGVNSFWQMIITAIILIVTIIAHRKKV
jgi:ribose/xylose/arabinose/galactoside ABC-type transport system permease subunit